MRYVCKQPPGPETGDDITIDGAVDSLEEA
eukprot:COSAG02_NODE_9354_length_2246_cov_3.238472_3_plen_30_part_00